MTSSRIQLTLFVSEFDALGIEEIRRIYNPIQYGLIKSHVTLAREDELENLNLVKANLGRLQGFSLVLEFGEVIRFSEGKGLLLPAIGTNQAFHELRQQLLLGAIENPRIHEPHITLMHPRNSSCTDEIFEKIRGLELPKMLIFNKISLIEQKMGQAWKVLEQFN